jgi:hypothetical protein
MLPYCPSQGTPIPEIALILEANKPKHELGRFVRRPNIGFIPPIQLTWTSTNATANAGSLTQRSAVKIEVERSLARLDEFELLEENWDSYGAPPLDISSIEESREVLKLVEHDEKFKRSQGVQVYPIPNRSGGVSLYFELASRELRIKFYPYENKKVVYRVNKTDSEHFHYDESPYDRNSLEEHFSWLISLI